MNNGKIWLGSLGNEQFLSGIERTFSEGEIEILREGRTASGKYVADIIAVKKKFTLNYGTVTNEILDSLLAIYNLGGIHSLKIERPDDSIDTYSVKFRPFSRSRILLAYECLWQGITLELEEV